MAPKGKKDQNSKQRNTEEEVEEPLQAVVRFVKMEEANEISVLLHRGLQEFIADFHTRFLPTRSKRASALSPLSGLGYAFANKFG